MSLAEIILRVACGLAGWAIVYVHLLLVALIPGAVCGSGEQDPFLGTLVLGVLTTTSAWLLPMARPMASSLRWLALPLLVLVPLAARAVGAVLLDVTFGGSHPCAVFADAVPAASPAASRLGWHAAWAPLQIVALLAIAAGAFRLVRAGRDRAVQPA